MNDKDFGNWELGQIKLWSGLCKSNWYIGILLLFEEQ